MPYDTYARTVFTAVTTVYIAAKIICIVPVVLTEEVRGWNVSSPFLHHPLLFRVFPPSIYLILFL
jgi:hypothetical protein